MKNWLASNYLKVILNNNTEVNPYFPSGQPS